MLEIDQQWYVVSWENEDGEEQFSSQFTMSEFEKAIDLLKTTREQFPDAAIFFNAEISIKMRY